jgi:hypothetical protein
MKDNADRVGGLSLPADYAAKILLGHKQFENRTSLTLGFPHLYCVGVTNCLATNCTWSFMIAP